MRKTICKALPILMLIVFLTGCNTNRTYSFAHASDQISSIEIIEVPSYWHYTPSTKELLPQVVSVVTVPEDQWEQFLSDFHEIPCLEYYSAPATNLGGEGIRITYKDGSYEVINVQTGCYIKDNDLYYPPYFFDEEGFHSFIEKYASDESF